MRKIIIGSKRNNIFYMLRRSWITGVLLVFNMVFMYAVYGDIMTFGINTFIVILILCLAALNV